MSENEQVPVPEPAVEPAPAPETPSLAEAASRLQEALSGGSSTPVEKRPASGGERPPREARPPREPRKEGDRKPGDRNRRPEGKGDAPRGEGGGREGRPPREGGPREGGGRRDDRGSRGPFRPDFQADIELDKLMADPLYLDNQAHAVVARMRDMDSGTKSQLRRFYNAVRRACGTAEADRQHQFVMLRARLAYTIARHSLRSLDGLERLLLQVTRKNEARGYERFRDLFEAIIAYNE